MEKQNDQEFAHLEVKRLCGVFGAPLPPVEEIICHAQSDPTFRRHLPVRIRT